MSISINGNGITSANIADGAITNADISSSAAIDGTKISGSFGKVLQVVHFSTLSQGSVALAITDTDLSPSIVDTITPLGTDSSFLIQARWAGETTTSWSQVWNILRDGVRVNAATGYVGLAAPTITYYSSDNASTSEMVNITTLDTSLGSVIGTPIVFKLVGRAISGTSTTWTNRTFNGGTEEQFSSEIIITEIGA